MLNNRFLMPSLKLTALENSRCVIRKEQNLLFKKEDKNKKHNNKNIYHSVQECCFKMGNTPPK